MEHRGVLVAIAGRRDGVRVYALEEVKRAVEWRIEVEMKREREKNRREEQKKASTFIHDNRDRRGTLDRGLGRATPPLPSEVKAKPDRRATVSSGSPSASSTRTPQPKRQATPPPLPIPSGPPPAYTPASKARTNLPVPVAPTSSRTRTTSVNDVLAGTVRRGHMKGDDDVQKDHKDDWASSDDEAIDPMAAPSGSQALDERTSAVPATSASSLNVPALPRALSSSTVQGRRRPANLDLSLTRANPPNVIPTAAPPSPTPTLLSLQQALRSSPVIEYAVPGGQAQSQQDHADAEADDEEEVAASSPTTPTRERISLAEALLESRLPELPPLGSQRPQAAVLLDSIGMEDERMASPRTSESFSMQTRRSIGDASTRRRRRWSVFDGFFQPGPPTPSSSAPVTQDRLSPRPSDRPLTTSQPDLRQRQAGLLSRSLSSRDTETRVHDALLHMYGEPSRPSSAPTQDNSSRTSLALAQSPSTPVSPQPASAGPRFLPRLITNAFSPRRSEDQQGSPRAIDSDLRRSLGGPSVAQAPAPKLEYVKLPGTKGSIMVKAVETAKKR